MRKQLAAIALALSVPFAAQAKLPLNSDDPSTVEGEVTLKSCSAKVDGKQFTFNSPFLVQSKKADWDKIAVGKTEAQVDKLFADHIKVAREVLERTWTPALSEFTPDDVDAEPPSKALQNATARVWNAAGVEITKRTGVETVVGFEGTPDYVPGCKLTPR